MTQKNMTQLTQQFEFSASHRLHNPSLSDDENRELFGKCNNPHGHGHNYVVAVSVKGPVDPDGILVSLERLEVLVKERVIDYLDHRYLNVEVEEFQSLNPSVENIAIVIWGMLETAIGKLGDPNADPGVRLSRIRVYETPKTWADYCG